MLWHVHTVRTKCSTIVQLQIKEFEHSVDKVNARWAITHSRSLLLLLLLLLLWQGWCWLLLLLLLLWQGWHLHCNTRSHASSSVNSGYIPFRNEYRQLISHAWDSLFNVPNRLHFVTENECAQWDTLWNTEWWVCEFQVPNKVSRCCAHAVRNIPRSNTHSNVVHAIIVNIGNKGAQRWQCQFCIIAWNKLIDDEYNSVTCVTIIVKRYYQVCVITVTYRV